MSTEDHKRKYDSIASDEDNNNSSVSHKRQKLDEEKGVDLDSFQALPKEIRYKIFSYLNWKDAVRSQVVSAAWCNETLNALDVLDLSAPDLTTSNKTSWLLKRCPNFTFFKQTSGLNSKGSWDLLQLKYFHRLKALHLSSSSLGSINTLQLTKHLTGLVELTCFDGIEDVEFFNLCKEFSQRHLTKLAIVSNGLSNNGLQHISLLTTLEDVSVQSYHIHNGIYSITTNLRRLDLTGCSRIKNIDLQKFPNLESLTFPSLKLEDVQHCPSTLTQLRANYAEAMESPSIYQISQLKDLDLRLQSFVEAEDIWNLTSLVNLTRLNLCIERLDSNVELLPYLASLSQLKVLQFKINQPPILNFNIGELCTALPNLESLALINVPLHTSVNISSLQHLTSLRLEFSACMKSLGLTSDEGINGLDQLTNLEILALKSCSYPDLTHLTRLRSLTCNVTPHFSSDSLLGAAFIDRVASLPSLSLEEFVIHVPSKAPLQSSLSRLKSLQTNLRALHVVERVSTTACFGGALQSFGQSFSFKEFY